MLQKLILISAMTLALFLFSCDENNLTESKNEKVDFTTGSSVSNPNQVLIDDAGIIHNAVCQDMLDNYDDDLSTSSEISDAFDQIDTYMDAQYSLGSAGLSIRSWANDLILNVNMDSDLNDDVDDIMADINIQLVFSSAERQIIEDARIYLASLPDMNVDQITQRNLIVNKADQLLSQLNALTKTKTTDGDLAGPYLQIMKSSAQFWYSTYDDLNLLETRKNVSRPQFFIFAAVAIGIVAQADAAGYIVGWGKAYYDDVDSGVDSGSNARIGKGLDGAIIGSLGRVLI